MLKNDNSKKEISFYNTNGKKNLRTTIDGHFTCKVPKDLFLEKGIVVEIDGEPELYKVVSLSKYKEDNKFHDYYTAREYDELLDVKLIKSLDLTNRTEEEVLIYNELHDIKGIVKANYDVNGVALVVEGKLSKNQVIRYGGNVITITDLIKPEIKGDLIKVVGTELDRVILESVYRVYKIETETRNLSVLSEHLNWGDALLNAYRSRGEGFITTL